MLKGLKELKELKGLKKLKKYKEEQTARPQDRKTARLLNKISLGEVFLHLELDLLRLLSGNNGKIL
jgi:hypothetical protein